MTWKSLNTTRHLVVTETQHNLTESADTVKPLLKASKVGTISLGCFMESGMGGSEVGLD